MGNEEDTFNRLRKWTIYEFRTHVLKNPWDFVQGIEKRDHECAIRGWTWNGYCMEFNHLYSLDKIE